MKTIKLWLVLAVAILMTAALPVLAQQKTGSIHGHVQDPTGAPVGDGIVTLSTDGGKTAKYTFNTDASGDYKGSGIAPGTYTLSLRRPDTPKDKVLDQIENVKIVADQDTAQDDDMSRPEYIKKLTPEQQKQLEDIKQKNAEALKENAVIVNLNKDLQTARDDNKNKDYAGAQTIMQKDTALKPDAAVLWVELGIAQNGLKQYDDAATSLKKAIDLDAASKKPNPNLEGVADNVLGEALASSGKVPEAQAAYDAAARINPAGAAMYYTNEAIVLDRTGQADATAAAADKAIAADPTKAIAYYLKGKALINKATVDPKTQRIVAPPGCQEAYQKYLQLDPNGQFANDAKQILAEMGQKEVTKYKAK